MGSLYDSEPFSEPLNAQSDAAARELRVRRDDVAKRNGCSGFASRHAEGVTGFWHFGG